MHTDSEFENQRVLEIIIGIILLTPSIASIFIFFYNLIKAEATLKSFKYTSWTGDYGQSGGFTSALPIYFGLMALAGVLCIKRFK